MMRIPSVLRRDSARKSLGRSGESFAVGFLEKAGYRIVRTNFRSRRGEIDVIAEEGDVLVFVEVKTRESIAFGEPVEAVDRNKRRRMVRAALAYLQGLRELPPCRFDVVSVRTSGGAPRAELIRDAFEMEGAV